MERAAHERPEYIEDGRMKPDAGGFDEQLVSQRAKVDIRKSEYEEGQLTAR